MSDIADPCPPTLTHRETEILALVIDDRSARQIASIEGITIRTVKFHLSNIRRKFGVRTNPRAAALGVHYGLVRIERTFENGGGG